MQILIPARIVIANPREGEKEITAGVEGGISPEVEAKVGKEAEVGIAVALGAEIEAALSEENQGIEVDLTQEEGIKSLERTNK